MVFVWMTTDVSAFCQYSDLVVIVRVTLHELSPNAIATQVTMAANKGSPKILHFWGKRRARRKIP